MNEIFNLVKISDFIPQTNGEDGLDIDCLHHRNPQKLVSCLCNRCYRFKVNIGISIFVKKLGVQPNAIELDAIKKVIWEEGHAARAEELARI